MGAMLEQQVTERRRRPRIYDPFPAKVQGIDTKGVRFESDTVIDNLSSAGLYLRLMSSVEPGAKLFITFRLSTSASAQGSTLIRSVAIDGMVLRVEVKNEGPC